jgi:hypothetical protein
MKVLSLAVILLMVVGSFGAVTSQSNKDCDFNNLDEGIESRQYYRGLLPGGDPLPPKEEFPGFAPTSFDWRSEGDKDWTTPIKDQGQCGSCYAFGSYAVMEACIKIKSNKPSINIDLSEQYMVSCGRDWNGGYGCDGATKSETYGFIQDYGAIPESCFPYSSGAGNVPPCSDKCSGWDKSRYEIYNWGSVSSDRNSIKNALIQYGPLGTTFDTYQNFDGYSGGIYTPAGDKTGRHLVAIVGYNDNDDYWICKNSWGTGWGESGWFRIAYGVCGIEGEVVYLNVQPIADEKITIYAQDWDEDADGSENPPNGDWKNYGANCLRMGEDWNPEDANAYYMFDIGTDSVKNNMLVGIYYCDWAVFPGTGGPDLRVYNWETSSWKNWGNVGDHDKKKWIWKNTGTSANDYVNDDGWVWVRIHTAGDDDTVLCRIGVFYNPVNPLPKPNLDADGSIGDPRPVPPGSKVTDSFIVKNIGETGSLLDWEVTEWPEWGSSWSFNPSSGQDLEKGKEVIVEVTFYAPNSPFENKQGEIVIVNSEDSSDSDTVGVLVYTPRNKELFFRFIELIQNRFPSFFNFLRF